jgi:hypothetical protein
MFATLLGRLPDPPLPGNAPAEARLDAILAVQVDAGLEPVIDGAGPITSGVNEGESESDPVAAWRAAAARTDRLVKVMITGPISAGSSGGRERAWILDLADAGCRWIEVHEPAATRIGPDPVARGAFADAHRALTTDLEGVHLSLAITGGSAHEAGIETILAGAYASLAIDLIAGPDNWHLAVAAPAVRGIIAGALSTAAGSDDGPEVLLWAAGYAASTNGRGVDRVGLATAGSLADLSWDVATRKVRRLGEAARLAAASREEQLAAIDPRAIDARSAALGRYEPRKRRAPS